MKNIIFITGSTGFIGTNIVKKIIFDTDYDVFCLVRDKNKDMAVYRLKKVWWDFPELADLIGSRIEVIDGDITEDNLGLDLDEYKCLLKKVTHIIHAAADIRLDIPLKELNKNNVYGTSNVLKFAFDIDKDHGLKRFSYVSTAYIFENKKEPIYENYFSNKDKICARKFISNYEASKFEAELLIQNVKNQLPISIYRPSMVVGDSTAGRIKTFNTIYFPLRLYLTGKIKIFPINPENPVNLIPVDYVADVIVKTTFKPEAEGLIFNLVSPYEKLPTVNEMIKFVREWVKDNLSLKLPIPLVIHLNPGIVKLFYRILKKILPKNKSELDRVIRLLPYLDDRRIFNRENVDKLLGTYDISWKPLISKMLEYAVYMGFMHRSERSVHEQIIYRLNRKSRLIKYHDIIDGKIISRNTFDVRLEMLKAAAALKNSGINKGDRVAVVGYNNTRYLTLDVAIGLNGAISVPLYYTSPLDDINKILEASSAKILFIGSTVFYEVLDKFIGKILIVSFSRNPIPERFKENVISWDNFLSLSISMEENNLEESFKNFSKSSIIPSDLATIRYSSGTTGEPKGVMFDHRNIRWMAESLASLPPWKARTSKIVYLSFLPMNHVVEGILSTYSIYYAPSPVDIYFLENFKELQKVLPRVKPTIFFSVPRLYEKIWENFSKTKIGNYYINLKNLEFKKILGQFLKSIILRKSGLNKCLQLIVGSAPSNEKLLTNYKQMGIEIHNAYGLTEAPLITLNRFGKNKLGTVGQPLPSTRLKITSDGEIMVKGPQVTLGYFGIKDEENKNLFENGWLQTGDIGNLDKDGYLTISGRKKDLIVTSYGKNIQPLKIETMLRSILGISEAMVIGDNEPYCCALLWISSGNQTMQNKEFSLIDNAVAEINKSLSNPERIKRWAIMPYNLSIEGKNLTPNLKIKRKAILQQFINIIHCMYSSDIKLDKIWDDKVIHIGKISGGSD